MKKLIEYGRDDHPEGDGDQPAAAWAVTVSDDCEECGNDPLVVLGLEPVGEPGTGITAHLSPETARRLVASLRRALGEIGAAPD